MYLDTKPVTEFLCPSLQRAAGLRLDTAKVEKVLAEGKAAGIRMDEKVSQQKSES